MTKISISMLGLLLTAGLRIHGAQFSATLDTNSTPGNFYGALYLSFSSTNASDCYFNTLYTPPKLQWTAAYLLPSYTAPGSSAQIALSFTVAGEGPNQLNLYAGLTSLYDPQIGSGSAMVPALGPFLSAGSFVVGQPGNNNKHSPNGGPQMYFDPNDNELVTYDFGYSLPVDWDGTSGGGVGSWWVTYTITPVPEPSVGWLMALGGFGLWLVRAIHHRRVA